ncbi:MAG: four helix bundle protein [bacterium]
MKNKTRQFSDLIVWQKAHAFILIIYHFSLQFPIEEKYGLTSQLRRAAISITSNIAEGYGRLTIKDKIRFYVITSGSITEVSNLLYLARDLYYITPKEFDNFGIKLQEIYRLTNSLIRHCRQRM